MITAWLTAIAKLLGWAADEGSQKVREVQQRQDALDKAYGEGHRARGWTEGREEILKDAK